WDNAALVSPRMAQAKGLTNGDLIELDDKGRRVRMPVWIMPGQADGTITVHLGYGRTRAGRVGTGVGFNAYALGTSVAAGTAKGLALRKLDGQHPLANAQHHFNMEGRELVRVGTIGEYRKTPDFAQEPDRHIKPELTLYPDPEPQ